MCLGELIQKITIGLNEISLRPFGQQSYPKLLQIKMYLRILKIIGKSFRQLESRAWIY